MIWKCPNCQSANLAVEVKVMAKLHQSEDNFETEDVGSDHEWDETSHMQCDDCGLAGEAHEFEGTMMTEVIPERTKWYALDMNGDMIYLGEFESFHAADESLETNVVWVVDEETAHTWLMQLKGMLE